MGVVETEGKSGFYWYKYQIVKYMLTVYKIFSYFD